MGEVVTAPVEVVVAGVVDVAVVVVVAGWLVAAFVVDRHVC